MVGKRIQLGWALVVCLGAAGQAPAGRSLTLAQAVAQARANSPDFQAALVAQGIATEERAQARAGVLPSAGYTASDLYTQGGRYIANNGVHEYVSEANLHEDLSLGATAALRRAQAGEALARAQTEVAARGLAATVTQDYYTLLGAGHKRATAEQAVADARKYLALSQELERGGEAAHADVIKAQLELQDRERAQAEAELAETQARLGLAVLLFADFHPDFTLADDLDRTPPLPEAAEVAARAGRDNPALGAAQAALRQEQQGVAAARAGYFPTLGLDYWYGIDASEFAGRNAQGVPNLGSAAAATVSVPLWNWGATRAQVEEAGLKRQQAQAQLGFAQRQLLAAVQGDYAEARVARDALATLDSSRALASESLNLVALRYQAGEATILELVDAQNTLTGARDAYDDGQVRYRVALATLATLTGPLPGTTTP